MTKAFFTKKQEKEIIKIFSEAFIEADNADDQATRFMDRQTLENLMSDFPISDGAASKAGSTL